MNEETKHVSKKEWELFWQDKLPLDKKNTILLHSCTCSYCSDQMTASMPVKKELEAPAYLKEEILQKAKPSFLKNPEHSWRQFYLYRLKIGFAMICALFLLFSIDSTDLELERDSITFSFTETLHDTTKLISQKLNYFSTQLLMEVHKDAKQK